MPTGLPPIRSNNFFKWFVAESVIFIFIIKKNVGLTIIMCYVRDNQIIKISLSRRGVWKTACFKSETCFPFRKVKSNNSPSLPEDVRIRLLGLCGNQVNEDGILDLFSQKYRRQLRNKYDVREKLIMLLMRAATPPRPRVKTKPTKASNERRLQEKARHSERKANRRYQGDY